MTMMAQSPKTTISVTTTILNTINNMLHILKTLQYILVNHGSSAMSVPKHFLDQVPCQITNVCTVTSNHTIAMSAIKSSNIRATLNVINKQHTQARSRSYAMSAQKHSQLQVTCQHTNACTITSNPTSVMCVPKSSINRSV